MPAAVLGVVIMGFVLKRFKMGEIGKLRSSNCTRLS